MVPHFTENLYRFLLAYPILPYALLYFGSIAMALSQSFIASLKLLSLLWAAALRERWKWSFVKKTHNPIKTTNQPIKNAQNPKARLNQTNPNQNNQTPSLDIHMSVIYLILLTFHSLFRLCLTFFNEVGQANVMSQVCAQVHCLAMVLGNMHLPLRTQRTKELSKI